MPRTKDKVIGVRLETSVLNQLRLQARELRGSTAQIIRLAIDAYLDARKAKEQEQAQ